MDKGSCWHCKNLSIQKKEGEIFWHYRCRKFSSKGELDPSKFIYFEPCFEKKQKEYQVIGKEKEKKLIWDDSKSQLDNILDAVDSIED